MEEIFDLDQGLGKINLKKTFKKVGGAIGKGTRAVAGAANDLYVAADKLINKNRLDMNEMWQQYMAINGFTQQQFDNLSDEDKKFVTNEFFRFVSEFIKDQTEIERKATNKQVAKLVATVVLPAVGGALLFKNPNITQSDAFQTGKDIFYTGKNVYNLVDQWLPTSNNQTGDKSQQQQTFNQLDPLSLPTTTASMDKNLMIAGGLLLGGFVLHNLLSTKPIAPPVTK